MMNNIYLVISEQLYYQGSGLFDPPEDYCIFNLVIAKSPSQAKYLAYINEEGNLTDIKDIPTFYTELKMKNVPFEKQVLPDNPANFLGLEESLNDWLFTWKENFLEYEYQKNIFKSNYEMKQMKQMIKELKDEKILS